MKKDWQTTEPPRQGFYEVELANGDTFIAEWRERSKKEGKRWWRHVSDDPTVEKQPVPLEGVAAWRPASKEAIEQALKRELTLDEKIADAYKDYQSSRGLYPERRFPIPECRRLSIGQKVGLGNLKDPVVVGLHEDGEVVTLQYEKIDNNYGRPISHGLQYGTWHWLDIVRLDDIQETRLAQDSIVRDITYLNSSLDSLLHRMYHNGTQDDPDYQRGYVWTDADKATFLDSLFSGRELGRFMFVRYGYPHGDVLFDGKQRMHTLIDLVSSRLPYQGYYWHQLSSKDKHAVLNRGVQYADLNGERYTRAQLLMIFLEVNAGGVPQTEEHLNVVRELLAQELAKEAKSN